MVSIGPFVFHEEEIAAFKKRAQAELKGEDGDFQFSYLGFAIVMNCRKGVSEKISIEKDGRRVFARI